MIPSGKFNQGSCPTWSLVRIGPLNKILLGHRPSNHIVHTPDSCCAMLSELAEIPLVSLFATSCWWAPNQKRKNSAKSAGTQLTQNKAGQQFSQTTVQSGWVSVLKESHTQWQSSQGAYLQNQASASRTLLDHVSPNIVVSPISPWNSWISMPVCTWRLCK